MTKPRALTFLCAFLTGWCAFQAAYFWADRERAFTWALIAFWWLFVTMLSTLLHFAPRNAPGREYRDAKYPRRDRW